MICEWVDVIIAGVSGRAFPLPLPPLIKGLIQSKVCASDFFKDKHFTSFSTKQLSCAFHIEKHQIFSIKAFAPGFLSFLQHSMVCVLSFLSFKNKGLPSHAHQSCGGQTSKLEMQSPMFHFGVIWHFVYPGMLTMNFLSFWLLFFPQFLSKASFVHMKL